MTEREKLICEKCDKRLSRKTARFVYGKLLCSSCMFAPVTDTTAKDATCRILSVND